MPQLRSLQRRIALAFLSLVVGFVGAAVYVPLALWPVARRAEAIQVHRAEAIRVVGELTGATRELRSSALLAYEARWDEALVREEQERAVAAARDRTARLAAEYARLATPLSPESERAWRQLTGADLPDLDDAVEAAVAAPLRPTGDPTVIRRLVASGRSVDRGLQRLTDLNADATQADAARIHARVRQLAAGYVALAAVGAAGAALLVLQALGLLRGYATAAERRVAELEAFAGQVAHDLRSPLQTIQLAVGGIERKAEDESLQRLAARAGASVRRLDVMIRDLLQFARSGCVAGAGELADVSGALAELQEELQPAAERAEVRLTVTAAPGLHARIAAVALKSVVANLVENAIKYRRPGGGGRVDVRAAADAERVTVAVQDDGIGIAPALVPRLFDPFFRGARRPDSYGLGLATVKRLVESHQGTIEVASEEGRGSTFSVAFRRAEAPPGAPPDAAGGDAPAPAAAAGPRPPAR